jgi:hypothetical protein
MDTLLEALPTELEELVRNLREIPWCEERESYLGQRSTEANGH